MAQYKNGQQRIRGGERALRMMDGLAAQRMPPLMKMSRSCTPFLMCDRRRDLRSINSEVGIVLGKYN